MDSIAAAAKLKEGVERGCADDIVEVLCNLSDGTCDDAALIPLLEQVARADHFHYFDDNGAGGLPHPTGKPSSFRDWVRSAIDNIRENQGLQSDSRFARSLKSLDTRDVQYALEQLATSGSRDETLLPILEKIARKDRYSSYSYYGGGYDSPARLGEMARKAIERIRQNQAAARTADCRLCEAIPDFARANTGREEYFGAPITSLKRHGLGDTDDLFECPECGALFHWHDDRSFTGSGSNDEETLTRLSSAHAAALRAIVHRAGQPAGIVARLLALGPSPLDLTAISLRERDPQLVRELVPALLDAAAQDNAWPADFLKRFADAPEDARVLLRALEGRPDTPALTELRTHARTATCSICRLVTSHRPLSLRRDAPPLNLAALKQLSGSGRNDVWECPECDSFLHWTSEYGVEGSVARVADPLANALRKCIHHAGAADERAIETVFACGKEFQQPLVAYAMRQDSQLVMHLVPFMVATLALGPEPWLRDWLCKVAQDPIGAAAVRAAIAKVERPNSSIEFLAARTRAS